MKEQEKKHWSEGKNVIINFECFTQEEYNKLLKVSEEQGNEEELGLQIQSIVLDYLNSFN